MTTHLDHALSFKGKYVQLIPLAESHAEELVSAVLQTPDPAFSLTSVPQTFEAMRTYIQCALEDQTKKNAIPFSILDLRADRLVGSTRFGNIEYWTWPDKAHPLQRDSSVPDALEIGWTWLVKEARRSGINTEMKLLMLTHAFETWKVHRVLLKTDSRNQLSRRAMERLGIRFDGILRADMPAFDGKIRDSAYYSILISEWPEIKKMIQKKLI